MCWKMCTVIARTIVDRATFTTAQQTRCTAHSRHATMLVLMLMLILIVMLLPVLMLMVMLMLMLKPMLRLMLGSCSC